MRDFFSLPYLAGESYYSRFFFFTAHKIPWQRHFDQERRYGFLECTSGDDVPLWQNDQPVVFKPVIDLPFFQGFQK